MSTITSFLSSALFNAVLIAFGLMFLGNSF